MAYSLVRLACNNKLKVNILLRPKGVCIATLLPATHLLRTSFNTNTFEDHAQFNVKIFDL